MVFFLFACNGKEEPKTPSESVTESEHYAESESTEEENTVDSSVSEDEEESSASEISDESSVSEESTDSVECTPLLYRAEKTDGGVLYLFGTVHLGDERMVFPDYVMNAYNESDFLCVEADMAAFGNDMDLQMEAVKKMLCEPGKTAKDYLGEELYNSAVDLLDEKGMYIQAFDYYRPIMWESLITEALISDSVFEANIGADMQLLDKANADGKEIREAEGVLYQYDLMMSAGDEPFVLTVAEMIKYKDSYIEELTVLYEAWLEGDANKLAGLNDEDYSELSDEDAKIMKDYEDILITQRNLAMADLAEDYLEEDKTGFFAVGAGHIVGEGGLAELLADRGYTVTVVE